MGRSVRHATTEAPNPRMVLAEKIGLDQNSPIFDVTTTEIFTKITQLTSGNINLTKEQITFLLIEYADKNIFHMLEEGHSENFNQLYKIFFDTAVDCFESLNSSDETFEFFRDKFIGFWLVFLTERPLS